MGAVLEIDKLKKCYGDKAAVDEISISMEHGIYGLVGPNGAGKTTLMKMLAGLIKPDAGKIIFNGKNIKEMGREYNNCIAFMPQEFGFYPFYKGIEILDYFRILKDSGESREELLEILGKVNLADAANKKVRAYSGGMKRRLGIAVAFLGKPELMIFDEPTAGLDPEERIRFKQILKKMSEERVIIISTHILSDVEALCDKIVFMENGKVLREIEALGNDEKLTGELEDRYMEILGSK